jgi:hypothetical protein
MRYPGRALSLKAPNIAKHRFAWNVGDELHTGFRRRRHPPLPRSSLRRCGRRDQLGSARARGGLWRQRLEVDLDNFRAGMAWALDSAVEDDAELAMVILGGAHTRCDRGEEQPLPLRRASRRAGRAGRITVCEPGDSLRHLQRVLPRGFPWSPRAVP